MVPLDVRRRQFKVFVQRAVDHAKLTRGWTVPKVARETGVGVATIYRWLNEEWTDNPKPELIEKFCDGLNLSPAEAFMILWPGKKGHAKEPPVMMMDPDFETLQRKLNDPKVPEQEKYLIRENVRTLALRDK